MNLNAFTGKFPRVPPHLLPPGAATEATDCDFSAGALTGLVRPSPTQVSVASGTKSMYVHDGAAQRLFYWNRDVTAVRGPVADDRFDRFYWLDDGTLYVSNGNTGGGEPAIRYKVGVPFPTNYPVTEAVVLDLSGYSYSLAREDSAGAVVAGPVGLVARVTHAEWYKLTVRLDGDVASLQANASGTFVLTMHNSFGYGHIRPSGAPITTAMHPDLNGYLASLAVNADHAILMLYPNTRQVIRRGYVYTYVNQYGEESAPSDASTFDVPERGVCRVTMSGSANADGYCPVTRVRLYRAETGVQGTAYLFHSEYDNQATITVDDNLPGTALGEPLSTFGFYPPEPGAEVLSVMPNGMLVLSKLNQVHIAEQYLPYAWRPTSTQVTQGRVMGLCPAEGGMYVTTTAEPYFLSGQTPDACTLTKITSVQAGVSRHAICNIGDFVVWATHDGLVTARGVTVSLDWSHKFFTREAWRARYGGHLSAIRLNAHDGNLLVWFTDGHPGFLMRFDGEAVSLTDVSMRVQAAYVDPLADSLYVYDGSQVLAFKGSHRDTYGWGDRLPFQWRSGDFIHAKPRTYGAVMLAGRGRVTLVVYADAREVHRVSVQLGTDRTRLVALRLPAGFLGRVWSFRVDAEGNTSLMSVKFGGTVQELVSG